MKKGKIMKLSKKAIQKAEIELIDFSNCELSTKSYEESSMKKNAIIFKDEKYLLKYIQDDNFKLIVLDMKDIEKINEDFDICIHLAWGGIGKSGRMDKSVQNENIENTVKLMHVCKNKNAKR